jgi:hypothetical protein
MKNVAEMLRAAATEAVGLFVEDRVFALAIALWIAATSLVSRFHYVDARISGGAFVAGLLLILLASVARAARRSTSSRS